MYFLEEKILNLMNNDLLMEELKQNQIERHHSDKVAFIFITLFLSIIGLFIDKIVLESEIYQLPAPMFETINEHTVAILFAYKELKDMDKSDKIRACYLHAGLRYIQRDYMTNTTLRERFGIDKKNISMVSKIINETLQEKKIYIYDESVGTRARKYITWWAK